MTANDHDGKSVPTVSAALQPSPTGLEIHSLVCSPGDQTENDRRTVLLRQTCGNWPQIWAFCLCLLFVIFTIFFLSLRTHTHTQTHTHKHSQRAAAVGVLISINSWTGFYGEVHSLHYPRKPVVTKKGRFSHHYKQQHLSAVMYYTLRTQTNLIWAM